MDARINKFFLCLMAVAVAIFWDAKSIMAENPDKETVNSVEVQLNISGEIYEGLQERIEYSIGQIGDRILLSQKISLLKDSQETVKAAIFNIFSKVLTGFKLESVELFIGTNTKVVIHLTPISPLILQVKVNIGVQKLAPEIVVYVNEISKKVEGELNRIFDGLPTASISWAEGIFDQVVNFILDREFPGFDSHFSLQPGEITTINIDLTQQEPLVDTVKVIYTAENIPVIFVKLVLQGYKKKFDILKGLPVGFLTHYQPRLEEFLFHYLDDFSNFKKFGMLVDLKIKPGMKTQIELNVQSRMILVNLEARYYFSIKESYGNCQSYISYRTDNFELFSRLSWWGKSEEGNMIAGGSIHLLEGLTGGLEYDFKYKYKSFDFHYQFDRGDYFNLKLGFDHSPTEAVIGIKLNEITNLELVDNNNNYGLQVMFHF